MRSDAPRPYVLRGSGGTAIAVSATPTRLSRGESLEGTVTLTGGNKPRTVRTVRVELHEHWQASSGEGTATHYEPRAVVALGDGMDILPGASRQWPFRFTLPYEGRVTTKNDQEGWSLYAHAVIRWGVDPRHRLPLTVLPEPEILAMDAELAAVGFTPISTVGQAEVVILNRRAPRQWSPYIDAIAFHCVPLGNRLQVVAEVNWQERHLGDVLRAIMRRDRTHHEFTLAPQDAKRTLDRFFSELGLPAERGA